MLFCLYFYNILQIIQIFDSCDYQEVLLLCNKNPMHKPYYRSKQALFNLQLFSMFISKFNIITSLSLVLQKVSHLNLKNQTESFNFSYQKWIDHVIFLILVTRKRDWHFYLDTDGVEWCWQSVQIKILWMWNVHRPKQPESWDSSLCSWI